MMRNDMTKRPFLIALALVALASLAGPTWAASQFGGGSGTEGDPYRIKTRAHLAAMDDDGATDWTKGKHFCLVEDIDLNGKAWTPIDFKGRFDGNGHAVIGLKVAVEGSGSGAVAGLFGSLDGATIEGLTVHGSVSAKDDRFVRAGGVAGLASESSIERCDFVGTVKAVAGGWTTAGGVVGDAYATAVKDCTASGAVEAESEGTNTQGPGAAAGGIVGTFVGDDKTKHVLEACISDVELTAKGGAGQKTGGVAATYWTDDGGTSWSPSGNRWYGKGASAGVDLGRATVPGETFTPSDEGATKGKGSAVLSRWLPEGKVGRLYDAKVIVAKASSSTSELNVSEGQLPDGLGLVGTKISGIPMQKGTSKFMLTAGSSTQKVSINVEDATSPVSITTTELPPVKVGEEFSFPLEASGATAPAKWSVTVGLLPEGASLSEDGVLSGKVDASGSWPFTVMVVDSKGYGAAQALTLTVGSKDTYAIEWDLGEGVDYAVAKVGDEVVERAAPGTRVYIVFFPMEANYELDDIFVIYGDGNQKIEIEEDITGAKSFIMPEEDVLVKITMTYTEVVEPPTEEDDNDCNIGVGTPIALLIVPLLALRRRKR